MSKCFRRQKGIGMQVPENKTTQNALKHQFAGPVFSPKRVTMRKTCAFLFLLMMICSYPRLEAQEMQGFMNNVYAGFNSAGLNPSFSVATPYYLEIDLITAQAFIDNNYVYLAKDEYKFSRFFEKNPQFPTHQPDNQVAYDRYTLPDKWGLLKLGLRGPSVSLTTGRNSYGLTTAVRSETSIRNLPYELAKFIYSGLDFSPQWGVNYKDERDIHAASLTWSEIGLNYSRVVRERYRDYYTAGINVRYLKGFAGAYVNTDNVDYMIRGGDTLDVFNSNAEGGISVPIDYQDNTFSMSPLFPGSGFAFDLGISYQRKDRSPAFAGFSSLCAQQYIPYDFRVSASLIDLGFIRFKQHAMKLALDSASTFWPGFSSTTFTDVDNAVNILGNRFYANPTDIVSGNEITVGLPAALSVQADFNAGGDWYLGGLAVYPFSLWKASVRRQSLFTVIPHYEKSGYSFSFPVSLYNYSKPKIGFSFRFGGFFAGTDNLGSYFSFSDFTGIDVYFGLRIAFLKGDCKAYRKTTCGNNEYLRFKKAEKELRPKKLENQ
jgi:hypothetical protein